MLNLPWKDNFRKNKTLSFWHEDKLTNSNFKQITHIQYVLPIITIIKGSVDIADFDNMRLRGKGRGLEAGKTSVQKKEALYSTRPPQISNDPGPLQDMMCKKLREV